MAILVTLRGPEVGRQFPLDGRTIRIGRQLDCDILLESTAVSRRHAQLVVAGDGFLVEDLGSSNGTYVNGERVSGQVAIHENDTLQVGPYLFGLRADAEPESTLAEDGLIVREQVPAQPASHTLYTQNPAHKLQVVLEISQLLARTLEIEPLLGKMLDHLLNLFPQAERGMVLLGNGDRLAVRAQRSRDEDDRGAFAYSRTIVHQALENGVGILSEDVRADGRFATSATLLNLSFRSLLCAPLIGSDGRRLGVIQLDRSRAGTTFTGDDLQLLTAVALQAAVVLENASLHAELVREARLRQEVEMAREIQEGFLPTNFKPLGERNFELFARVHPAREVSGDFYDFFSLGGKLAFFVGDVSGKGMPAALFMVAVRTLCRHLAPAAHGPSETLTALNDALAVDNPSAMFVTLVHGIYDPTTGEVVLASGGHPPPLLRRPDGTVEPVALPTGRLLGYGAGNLGLADVRVTLAAGETLVVYTDGFTEARAPDNETMFGEERLRAALGGVRTNLPLAQCDEAARDAVESFTGRAESQDDMTLLLLRRD
jgi:sigma-B regulation protein RsbU (phosphoserine phosphatase)